MCSSPPTRAPAAIGASAANPVGIAADTSGAYFAELHGAKLTRVLPDGSVDELTATNAEPRGVAVRNDYVYWVEAATKKVRRVEKALDADYAYVTVNGENRVLRVAKK